MSRRMEVVFLKQDDELYGRRGRALEKRLYKDLPKEHKKLFVTERTYMNHLKKEENKVKSTSTDSQFVHIDVFDVNVDELNNW